ncbi:MAG: tetratricopeptide repeat protein [wastewater metagenome]|nr:tetratricopeptide repeat protein [Candidatus Loosdrechtia aerotolerans]
MVNYYDILEVHHEVSKEEIRRSFRALIRKYHPDIYSQNRPWAESKTKIIIQAYKTLSNTTTREQYDRLYKHHFQSKKTQKVKKEETTTTNNTRVRVRTILTDLLDGRIHNAVKNYEHLLKENGNANFLLNLNHRDYTDCKILLGEAYEKLGKYELSLEFYEFILEKEKSSAYRQHFLTEIKERTRNIYCRKLAKRASPEKALQIYRRVLELELCKSQNAFIYKKMAECYMKLHDYEKALQHLTLALSLKPNLQGTNKLKMQLKQYIPNLTI